LDFLVSVAPLMDRAIKRKKNLDFLPFELESRLLFVSGLSLEGKPLPSANGSCRRLEQIDSLLKLFGHGSACLGHIAGTVGVRTNRECVMLGGEAQQSWEIITHVYLSIVAKKRSRPFREFIGQIHLLLAYCPFHHAMTNPKFLSVPYDANATTSNTTSLKKSG
jgi:hypothetical protein